MTRMLKEAILLAGENVGNQLAETAKEEQNRIHRRKQWRGGTYAASRALLPSAMPSKGSLRAGVVHDTF
jgi:hypothetical protein